MLYTIILAENCIRKSLTAIRRREELANHVGPTPPGPLGHLTLPMAVEQGRHVGFPYLELRGTCDP